MKSQVLKKISQYFIFFVCLLMIFSLIGSILKIKTVNQEIEEVKSGIEKLKTENKKLKEKLEIVKSEEFVEKQLRDKLGLSKEGEIIIVLPEDEILRKLAPKEEEEEEVLPDPNWKKWLKLFF